MNRYKYSVIVEGKLWSSREIYRAWLVANLGERDYHWAFLHDKALWYRISFINKEDATAFKLRFQCQ